MGKKRILWLDCSSGVAGDMLAAALLDAGGDRMAMERALESLPLDGFTICVSHVTKHSIRCCDFDVVLQPGLETHDHDMDHLFGHLDEGVSEPAHGHDHDHGHDHAEGHGHLHDHVHRGLGDVLDILESAELTERARSLAQRTFFILADAEAEAHGATRDTVHFHEVGSVDSIVDVVAVSVLAESLHLDEVHVTGLTEGTGLIRTSHGVLPVPVPAVSSILRAYEIPVRISERQGECITPTGAALIAALATSFEVPGPIAVRATGYGAGKRDYPWSNYVRAIVGTDGPDAGPAPNPISEDSEAVADTILKLECEVDDCTGEALGETLSRLMDAGAREAHWIPLGTKKGRPAWQLQVICTPEGRERLEYEIFRNTTTIGIRRVAMERTVLPREELTLNVDFGRDEPEAIHAKRVTLPDGSLRVMPEADDVARVSKALDLPLQEVWQAALAASHDAARRP